MKTLRLLSADVALKETLQAALGKEAGIKLLPSAASGPEMLELVLREPPDLMFVDLDIPLVDGVDVITLVASMPLPVRPLIVALCSFMPFRMLELISEHIACCFYKPVSEARLIKEIIELAKAQSFSPPVPNHRFLELMVSDCLKELGIPAHLIGYHCLREGIKIILCAKSPMKLSIGRHIYKPLGELFEVNESAVEHAMRHAIDCAWMRADVNLLQSYFGNTYNEIRATPSNSQFMYMLADRIHNTLNGGQAYVD